MKITFQRDSGKSKTLMINKSSLGKGALFFVIGVLLAGFLYASALVFSNPPVDYSQLGSYTDENLNVMYAIPGGTWVMADIDTTDTKSQAALDAGEDKVFNLYLDRLSTEVISSAMFHPLEGYKESDKDEDVSYGQYLSFAFRGIPEGYTDTFNEDWSIWREYLDSSWEYDAVSQTGYSLVRSTLYEPDEYGGVYVTGEVSMPTEDGNSISQWISQYFTIVGKNLMVITFCSVEEDLTVLDYLQYFGSTPVYYNSADYADGYVVEDVDISSSTESQSPIPEDAYLEDGSLNTELYHTHEDGSIHMNE